MELIITQKHIDEQKIISPLEYMTERETLYKDTTLYPDVTPKIKKLEDAPYLDAIGGTINTLYKDKNLFGYERTFYQEIHGFNYINKLSFSKKKELLLELYSKLKEVHDYITLENIYLKNIYLTEDGLKIFNWDEDRISATEKERQKRLGNEFVRTDSKQNDALKLFLCTLSYLYEIDFENIVYEMGIDYLYVLRDTIDDLALEYLEDTDLNNFMLSENVIYFDDYLNKMKSINPTKEIILNNLAL